MLTPYLLQHSPDTEPGTLAAVRPVNRLQMVKSLKYSSEVSAVPQLTDGSEKEVVGKSVLVCDTASSRLIIYSVAFTFSAGVI